MGNFHVILSMLIKTIALIFFAGIFFAFIFLRFLPFLYLPESATVLAFAAAWPVDNGRCRPQKSGRTGQVDL